MKAAYPNLAWINIVQDTFKVDAENAKMRLQSKYEDIEKAKQTIGEIQAKYYKHFQTTMKVGTYGLAAPAAIGAG